MSSVSRAAALAPLPDPMPVRATARANPPPVSATPAPTTAKVPPTRASSGVVDARELGEGDAPGESNVPAQQVTQSYQGIRPNVRDPALVRARSSSHGSCARPLPDEDTANAQDDLAKQERANAAELVSRQRDRIAELESRQHTGAVADVVATLQHRVDELERSRSQDLLHMQRQLAQISQTGATHPNVAQRWHDEAWLLQSRIKELGDTMDDTAKSHELALITLRSRHSQEKDAIRRFHQQNVENLRAQAAIQAHEDRERARVAEDLLANERDGWQTSQQTLVKEREIRHNEAQHDLQSISWLKRENSSLKDEVDRVKEKLALVKERNVSLEKGKALAEEAAKNFEMAAEYYFTHPQDERDVSVWPPSMSSVSLSTHASELWKPIRETITRMPRYGQPGPPRTGFNPNVQSHTSLDTTY